MSIIELNNVCKSLNKKEILKNVSINLDANRIYALLGPNGAGKTTLIRILLGLYKIDSGTLEMSIRTKDEIGFMLHANGLYPMLTCYENLELYAEIYKIKNKNKISEVLDLVGLLDKKSELVHTLSKGMRQKLALARTILHNPQILILDEPTVGLDIETKIWFRSFLKEFVNRNNCTVLLSSHEMTELEKVCTDVIILRDGTVVNQSEVDTLDISLEQLYLSSAENKVI